MRHLPNLICLLRIALVWPIVASIARGQYALTLLLFFVAAASDGLDGFLAKRFNWTSELGKLLDPIADKLLLIAVFLVATWYGLIPRSLTVLAVARDVMIGLGAIIFRIGWGPLNGQPMISSKINTLLQLLYVLGDRRTRGFRSAAAERARCLGAAHGGHAAGQRLSLCAANSRAARSRSARA